ncbi:MAG: glycosyltransferase [bacterium]|nr:glycosyltransferase [bacterium]
MLNVSLIIPFKDYNEIFLNNLLALNHQEYKNFEVLIIDNSLKLEEILKGSNILNKIGYELKIIKGDGKSRASARNIGILNAKNDITLFLDADMLAHKNLIKEHIKIYKSFKNKNIATIGLELRINNLSILNNFNNYLDFINNIHYNYPKSRSKLKSRKLKWYKFLTGNLSSYKENFIKAGLFDEAFKTYGFEDLELGYRFNKLGINLIFNPLSVCYHLHPLNFNQRTKNKIESIINLSLFFNKYKNKNILKVLGINIFSDILYKSIPKNILTLIEKKLKEYYNNNNIKENKIIKLLEDIYVNYHFYNSFKNQK